MSNFKSVRGLAALLVVLSLFLSDLSGSTRPVRATADLSLPPATLRLFKNLWNRVDGPLAAGRAQSSFIFGPGPFAVRQESYAESPGGARTVVYFDKSRMELTDPFNQTVTNGLLVNEMISGQIQTGDNQYKAALAGPAKINVVGDRGNWLTYADLAPYASLQLDHRGDNRVGQTVDLELTQADGLQPASQAGQQPLSYYEPILGHNIPKAFWDYLNSMGTIYDQVSDSYTTGQTLNWLRDVGYPLTEAYWVRQTVGGIERDILVQAFQRRVLTLTPDNPPAFQLEMGNVGRHYEDWRYGGAAGPNQNWTAPDTLTDSLGEVVRGKTGRHQVAITLDAGSTAVAFPKEIAALDRYKVKVTFFLTGEWATQNPIDCQIIAGDGMEIANHTYSHPDLATYTDDQVLHEINQGATTIERYTGRNPRPLFRFPYGSRTGHDIDLLNSQGYRSIYWTYDSLDSVGDLKSADFLISRITGFSDQQLDGAIILMHLGNATSGDALGPIIENLQSRGFQIVTISQLLS